MTFGTRNGGGRRSAKRVDAPLPALLITMSNRHPALLFDISQTGAKLRPRKHLQQVLNSSFRSPALTYMPAWSGSKANCAASCLRTRFVSGTSNNCGWKPQKELRPD